VVGLDNYNDYYDPQTQARSRRVAVPGLDIRALDLGDRDGLAALFDEVQPTRRDPPRRAGRRALLADPSARLRRQQPGRLRQPAGSCAAIAASQHLVYASSSSVYGDSATPPFSEDQRIDQPRRCTPRPRPPTS
jgi:UDP-glucuronate 4-epimerase